ncbi:MAG TPA: AmmeMemoRadiSam system radical SAM enzyme [Thermotogota bacterium]|nr:AmmeMemoRadiSam system radical SAM enzyme [Thermotogota bacterium]HRW34234.1 AmmeMemoRadiSam system radical SAM enzyme [Thermotogota bacterium]
MREALFYEEIGGSKVRCNLCPHHCEIEEGQCGLCRVRVNKGGVLYTLTYGTLSSISNDPIEKKPLYHFHPGTMILSVGSWGCNMTCPWCQNWEIAHEKPQVQRVNPDRLIDLTLDRELEGIAYTYNEPIVSFEFVLDTSRMASSDGLYNVMVTNGYIEEAPLKLLLQTIQAMNIDLKGFNPKFYQKRTSGDLETIKKNIKTISDEGLHLELTTLIIPGENDSPTEMEEEAAWIASINDEIPLHLSKYHPAYKFNKPPTPDQTLLDLYAVAKKHLKYVYIGNANLSEGRDTHCPSCGNLLIKRNGYHIEVVGIQDKKCTKCQAEIKIKI